MRNNDSGIYLEGSDRSEVLSNTVESHNASALTVRHSDGTSVSENEIVGAGEEGVLVEWSDETVVEENTIEDTGNGIYLDSSDDAAILSNAIEGNSGDGVRLLNVHSPSIAFNTIENNENGIHLDSSDGASILSNDIEGNSGDGVHLLNTDTSSITDNTVEAQPMAGIRLDVSTEITVQENDILDTEDGIVISGTSTDIDLLNNTVHDLDEWALVVEDDSNATVENLDIGESAAANTMLRFDIENAKVTANETAPGPPTGMLAIDRYFEAENTTDGELLNLELAYETADIGAVDPETLSLWRFDEDDDEWVELPDTAVNTSRQVVTANVTAFSTFGAFGADVAPLLDVGDFGDEFPDGVAPEDYGEVDVPVEETDGVETENLTVTLVIEGDSEGEVFNETIDDRELDGESDEFTFAVGTLGQADNYTAKVTADADNAAENVRQEVFEVAESATAVLSDLDIAGQGTNATVGEGDNRSVSVNLTNAGGLADTFDVTLEIDDSDDITRVEETEEDVTVDAGETEVVTFENVTGGLDKDQYAVEVTSGNETATGTLVVGDPAVFLVVDVTTSPVLNDPFDVTATIENAGDAQGTQTVELVELTALSQYADSDGTVQTSGLLVAINDWRANEISTTTLLDVINAWRSGQNVDGAPIESAELTLDGGQTEDVTFGDVPEDEYRLRTDDDATLVVVE